MSDQEIIIENFSQIPGFEEKTSCKFEKNQDLGGFFDINEQCIFKLRHHFSPELTTIMEISMGELSEIFSKHYEHWGDR